MNFSDPQGAEVSKVAANDPRFIAFIIQSNPFFLLYVSAHPASRQNKTPWLVARGHLKTGYTGGL
jgi:hypothetical protein